MKKIIVFIALTIAALSLVACGTRTVEATMDTSNSTVELNTTKNRIVVEIEYIDTSNATYDCIREVATDVMYLKYKGRYAGGLTVMLDPETGLPLTYTRYVEIYKAAESE